MVILFNLRFFKPEKIDKQGLAYNPTTEYIQNDMSGIIPDYLPKDIDWKNIKPLKETISSSYPEAQIEINENSTNYLIAQLKSDKDFKIIVNRFVFPNWQIKLDGQKIKCEIQDFVYKCQIPKGEHQFEFYWSEQGINQISNLLSILGIILLIYLCRYNKLKS